MSRKLPTLVVVGAFFLAGCSSPSPVAAPNVPPTTVVPTSAPKVASKVRVVPRTLREIATSIGCPSAVPAVDYQAAIDKSFGLRSGTCTLSGRNVTISVFRSIAARNAWLDVAKAMDKVGVDAGSLSIVRTGDLYVVTENGKRLNAGTHAKSAAQSR